MEKTITQSESNSVLGISASVGTDRQEAGLAGEVVTANWLRGSPVLYERKNLFLLLLAQKMIGHGFDRHSALAVVNEIQARLANYENPELLYSQFLRVQRELTRFGFQDKTTFYSAEPNESESGIVIALSNHWKVAGDFLEKHGKRRPDRPPAKERKLVTKTNIISKDSSGYIPMPNTIGT